MAYYYSLIILKFIIGFAIVITHMNLSGKTQLSQMTPIDFIGNFVLGGIIGGVIYSDTIPLYQYVTILIIGVLFISFLNFLTKRFNFFVMWPLVIPYLSLKRPIYNGKHLRKSQ